jgi:hypothetical protein
VTVGGFQIAAIALVGERASKQDDVMPRSKEFLLEQIARAKRFAAAMNTAEDRERFEKMAADYRSELEAAETEGQSSAPSTVPEDVAPTNDAVAAEPQPGGSEGTSSAPPASTDDQKPATG